MVYVQDPQIILLDITLYNLKSVLISILTKTCYPGKNFFDF